MSDCCATKKDYDLAIVGGGSAAFAAAIHAAELGFRAAIIEAGTLGGTCVNVGCVPSKTLLRAAEIVHRAKAHSFAGIVAEVAPPRFAEVMAQKDELVRQLRKAKYQDVLSAYPSIDLIEGRAAFGDDGALEVRGQPFRAEKLLLAMGASAWLPPIPGLQSAGALTSTGALGLTALPESLIVLGGSAVGLELAQFFSRMGTRVTVLEALPRIVPAEEQEIGEELALYLRDEGLDVRAGAAVESASRSGGRVQVVARFGEARETFEAEHLLVATGRRPRTAGMGLEKAGIELGPRGEVRVDGQLETTRRGVYAAGDVIGDPMFVYVAAHAGHLAAENALTDRPRTFDVSVVPRVTFTDPAVASVGVTEQQAIALGIDTITSKLPLTHVPRAIAARDTRGFIKLVADAKTKLLVGAHILAPEAGEIIEQAVMAIRFGIRVDQIASTLHPYLTLAEGIKLAAQTFEKDVAKLSCCAA